MGQLVITQALTFFRAISSTSVRRRSAAACALALLAAVPVSSQTPAGSTIRNTADARYRIGDAEASSRSNEDQVTVAERLDVVLALAAPPPALPRSAETAAVAVQLTNGGNGQEAFGLDAAVDSGSAAVRGFAADVDEDGRYDPAVDTRLADARTPVLAPGTPIRLFVLLEGTDGDTGELTLAVTARAVTGSGARGTTFDGLGDGGGDAVTGDTGAAATVRTALAVTTGDAPTFLKSQSVSAPDGSTTPVAGARVTYTLAARFTAPVDGARIDDPLPEGTRYVAGSLLLDGAPLSDGEDGDAGSVDAQQVRVLLGDIPGPATRTVQFQVTLE